VENAYRGSDALEKRRKLMEAWAVRYLSQELDAGPAQSLLDGCKRAGARIDFALLKRAT
jgi:hypothetical protein